MLRPAEMLLEFLASSLSHRPISAMSHKLLVFSLLILRVLSSNLTLPGLLGTSVSRTNTTAPNRASGSIIDEKLIKPVTEQKMHELDNYFENAEFLGMDLRFTGHPVLSPIHIRFHHVFFNATEDPPDIWRLAVCDPSNWTLLTPGQPVTIMQNKGNDWSRVNWNIRELKSSFDEAIARLRAAGCAETFISLAVTKTTEMVGPARIWFTFDYYRGRWPPMTHKYTA